LNLLRNKIKDAIMAFILLSIIAAAPFVAVSFASEGSSGPVERPIPIWESGAPGPWCMKVPLYGYNMSGGNYNPYSTAPNTSHILWRVPTELGGVIGGDQGLVWNPFYRAAVVACGMVFLGEGKNIYHPPYPNTPAGAGRIVALNEYTGEEIWVTNLPLNSSDPAILQISFDTAGAGGGAILYASWPWMPTHALDAFTGNVLWSFTPPGNSPQWTLYYNDRLYIGTNVFAAGTKNLGQFPWNFEPILTLDGAIWFVEDGIGFDRYGTYAINLTTGKKIWENSTFSTGGSNGGGGYHKIFEGGGDGDMYAFDVSTGAQVWKSVVNGSSWGYGCAIAYGNVYRGNYNGNFYCFDADTGQIVWQFNVNDYLAKLGYTLPTAYQEFGGWPWHTYPVAADGKVYASTEEESAQYVPGHFLYCFDAETGKVLWTYPTYENHVGTKCIADGMLFLEDFYTNQFIAFGKGPTAVEVSVPQAQIANGSYTWINGRVTDQSPSQKGTGCVADESMDAWMAYLNGGFPEPATGTIKGVPVTLSALKSDGSSIEIGTVTSDYQGYFSFKWTPPTEDHYRIIANFTGSESYWGSYGATDLAVGPTPVAPPNAEQVATQVTSKLPTFTAIDLAIIVAVAVAIVIGIVNLYALRKLRK
jgi:outer membrane protein assembly factor BamB